MTGIRKGVIVLMKFPMSALPGNRMQPDDWFPCIVTNYTDQTVDLKVFHPEQVFQKNSIPRQVSAPTVDADGKQTTMLVDNPEIIIPGDDGSDDNQALAAVLQFRQRLDRIEAVIEPLSDQVRKPLPTQPMKLPTSK